MLIPDYNIDMPMLKDVHGCALNNVVPMFNSVYTLLIVQWMFLFLVNAWVL